MLLLCLSSVWEMQRYSFNYTAMFELKLYLFNQNVYCGLLARSFLHDIEKGNINLFSWDPLGGITPSLRYQVACIRGCHRSLGSQSGEWPMVSYQFYQFWTSSTFKSGGVKCTESLVSCVGEMDEAFGIFQESNPFGNDRGNRVPEGLELNRSPLSNASGLSAPHLHTNHQQLLGQHKLRIENWYLLETRKSRAGRTHSITHRNFHIIVSNSNSI